MTDSSIINIGKASIFSSYPDWLVTVNKNYNGTAGPTNAIAGKPIPTNKWFSPLFWWINDLDYDPNPAATHNNSSLVMGSAIALRPMPAMYQVSPWGLMITYRPNPENKCGGVGDTPPCGWPQSDQAMGCSNWTNWRFDRSPNTIFSAMTISVDQLLVNKVEHPFFVSISDYGDWHADLKWDDGQRQLILTVLAGSPMIYGTASGGELEFQLPAADAPHPITFYDGQGNSLGQAYMGANPGPNFATSTDGIIGMSFKTLPDDTGDATTVYYAIYAPKGTTWSFTQGGTDTTKNPGREGYLSSLKSTNLAGSHQPIQFAVAVLPAPASGSFPVKALKAFANASGFPVSGTIFSWDSWDANTSTITAHYTFNGKTLANTLPSANASVITTLFKPHQKLMADPPYLLNEVGEPYTYNSPRGPLKIVQLPVNSTTETAQYSITYPYYGYVPALPEPQLTSAELTDLKTYLSADSSQTTGGIADFLTEVQPDAYSTGTKLYYKLMQMVFWLQQMQQVDTLPNWRNSTQSISRTDAIQLLVNFLKTDLEVFFSATRPSDLAYQWHYFNPAGKDSYGFSLTPPPNETPPDGYFPCPDGTSNCNPLGDPLLLSLQKDRPYWKLTRQALLNAQEAKKNPYIVLRGLDFTVNSFANSGPTPDVLMHLAYQQADLKQTQNVTMYAFFAPSEKNADPEDFTSWTQCVWTDGPPKGAIELYPTSSCGIGYFPDYSSQTHWRLVNIPYNGTSTVAPHPIPPGKYDIMLVFDCGANCTDFPNMCANGTIPPNLSPGTPWDGWELVLGPIHFQGKPYKFIAYNSLWNSLLGNASWYGSTENLSDHHFGWGYLIKAAALVAQFDTTVDPNTQKPWWDIEQGWGGIVNLMIRDVMDWHPSNYTDPNGLTFAHCKYLNPIEGHMYSNGHGNSGDGNDEESSSEAINFANACIEWGAVTGQDQIRDMGILLRSMYAQAVPLYWFNVDGDVLPSTTAAQPFPIAGQITGAGNRHDTFFSGGPNDQGCASRNSDVVAIQTLPVTAGTLRLTLFTPQLQVAWETVVNAGGAYCGTKAKCYLSTLLSFQALFDPQSAKTTFLSKADPSQSYQSWYNCLPSGGLKQPEDHSYATTFAFICSLSSLGAAKAESVSSPDLNPFYMPMADGSVLIYNYKQKSESYRIGNTSVTVPALCCLQVKTIT